MAVGNWAVDVIPIEGGVDWGITLHRADLAYQGKSTTLGDGISWANGPDGPETASAEIQSAGYYAVGVWKSGSEDLPRTGRYLLQFRPAGTVAVEELALRTRLGPIAPNPARARTAVTFDLAGAEDVALEVFDVRGAVVRTLAAGRWQPGRHRLDWDGRDAAGRPVASGVYLVRLRAGRYAAVQKLAMVD